jgi:hypothetical protein
MTEENVNSDANNDTDLGQFKTAEDLLKSYKEIQGAFTKVSQENKALKDGADPEELQRLQAELNETKQQLELLNLQPAQNPATKDFDESWMENPEATIDQRVASGIRMESINAVLRKEKGKNATEYAERYAYADLLSREKQYAGYGDTAEGVEYLFEEADKRRSQVLQQNSRKSLEHIFGEPLTDEHLAKLKTMVIGEKETNKQTDAYMPDTSTSTKSGADQNQNKDGIDDAVSKGDVDGVIDGVFKNILAE